MKLLKNKFDKELLFSLIFQDSVKQGTKVEVNILIDNLKSVTGALLEKYRLTGELSEFIYTNTDASPVMNFISSATKSSAKIGIGSSICSAIVSNPAATWTLLNTIQLLAFLPLNSLILTDNLEKFFKGIAKFNIIPNFLTEYYPTNTSGSPYLQAQRYGIKTSVFIINIGLSLIFLLAITLLWPFSFILSKITSGKFASKIVKLVENYKFNFFIRFWIQMYLEIGIYAVIQLKAVSSR